MIKEWRFIEHLTKDGILAMHDTNYHPGPKLFIENLNTERYIVEKHCTNSDDCGISFVRLR